MPKHLAISNESEYNSFYFDAESDQQLDDLTEESFFHETTAEYKAVILERMRELIDMLSFSTWARAERMELINELREVKKNYSELTILNVG